MASFTCINSNNLDKNRHLFSCLTENLRAQFPDLQNQNIESKNILASKFFLTHSKTKGFSTDPQTSSWLCCVGNPTTNTIEDHNLTQTLLEKYIKNQKSHITELHAPFTAIVFDAAENSLNIITDRIGIQHIFITQTDDSIIISTSSAAIAKSISAALDQQMLTAYFTTGNSLCQKTFYKNINKIPPATWLKIKNNHITQEKYWNPPQIDHSIKNIDQAAEILASKYQIAVSQRLAQNNRTSIELTGGLDSRFNLTAALKSDKKFHCWTIGTPDSPDVIIAKKLQQINNFDLNIITPNLTNEQNFLNDLRLINSLTDGETNALNIIASPDCNRQTVNSRDESISGVGGEIFRGFYYLCHKGLHQNSKVKIDRIINLKACPNIGFRPEIFSNIFPADHKNILKNMISSYLPDNNQNAYWNLDNFYISARQQFFAGRGCCFNNFFYRQQLPYFDNNILDLSYRLHHKYKQNSMLLKHTLSKLNPDFANIILTSGLPARTLNFSDTTLLFKYYLRFGNKAFRKILKIIFNTSTAKVSTDQINRMITQQLYSKTITDLLEPANMASSFLYNPDKFKTFINTNKQNSFANRYQIGLLLCFELLCRDLGDKLKT